MMRPQKQQYITIVSLVLGALLVLFIVASVLPAFLVDETEVMNDQTTRAAQDIINEVQIPLDFLQDGPLQEFIPYQQIEAPQDSGKTNPFGPPREEEVLPEEGTVEE